MGKFKKTLQNKQVPAVKNTKTSIAKKQRRKIEDKKDDGRKKDDKKSLNNTHKNNLKKLNASNKIAKTICTNMQNSNKKKPLGFKNKLVKDTERLNVPTKYSKDNKNTSEAFQKVQIKKRNRKRKRNKNLDQGNKSAIIIEDAREKNKKRKQNVNLDYINKSATTVDDAKKKNKTLQMPAKNLDLEHRKEKIKKFEKVNEKRLKQMSAKTEAQQIKPDEVLKLNKHKINIKHLAEMLANKSKPKQKVTQLSLRDRMMTQLRASRFRFINETLYSNASSQSKHYFKEDPDSFLAYHAGYKQQLEQWAVNPLDVIIASIKKLPKDNVIADFGCGEARLAASVPHMVHSFDFIALNDKVKACDMAHTPLLMNSVHVVVFCLSLMGSNLNDYIIEANRVLKNNGILKIAEVESRFEDVNNFIRLLRSYGFKNTWKDLSHNLFYFMDFKKEEDISMKRKNLSPITLKSCLYKKR